MKHQIIPIQVIRAAAHAMLLVMAVGAALFADNGGRGGVGISADVSHNSITVGDVISLDIVISIIEPPATPSVRSVMIPPFVIPPDTARDFGGFVVLSSSASIDENDSTRDFLYRYTLTTFRPQTCTIPSLKFLIMNHPHPPDTLFTDPIPIEIISVIPLDTPDSGLVIRDLKAQQKTGGADLRFLWILAAIAALVLAYFLLRKYMKKKIEITAAARLKPPYEEALEAIVILKEKKYLEQGAVREYTFELSEIFKRYIGRRYDTIASELTSEEIIDWLKTSPIGVDIRLSAERFFRTSDQVKFAKWKPDQQTIDGFMKDVKAFLEATKPELESQNEQKTETTGTTE
ncbi:MAG: BatD family protein [Chitinispirillales bacterium]|jgi:hypothetical protein|nr:BatD family protein [Chitinispirillales bacterium]